MGDAFSLPLAADAGRKSAKISGLYLGAVIIASCIYPVLLQRYTRARIQRVLNRGKRKG
jgi:hypothetical protein